MTTSSTSAARSEELQDRDPQLFRRLYQGKSDLERRKAYYLIEIARIYEPLPVSRPRLKKIGWTKLQLVGKRVTKDNLEEMLQLAEKTPAKHLERMMRGEKAIDNAHCVLMYLTPKQYKDLEKVLVQHGATATGRGILGKEAALMKALRKVKEEKPTVATLQKEIIEVETEEE